MTPYLRFKQFQMKINAIENFITLKRLSTTIQTFETATTVQKTHYI